MDFKSAVLTLILVIDPLGNIPNFMASMRSVPDARRLRVIARELLIALVILLGVFFCGRTAMQLLSLSDDALRISGGIVLFLIALRMVFPPEHSGHLDQPPEEEPFIVPLATPLIAGPSVMATIMFIAQREPERRFEWLLALFVAWLVSAIILLAAPFLARILQRRGLMAVERLMGMVLVVVSVQMFLDGLHLANLPAK
jgi:multiple antibiotic resistance protein